MGEPNTYLLKSIPLAETDPVIGRKVMVERTRTKQSTIADMVQPSRNLPVVTENVPGVIIGGTTNVYQYILTGRFPWSPHTTREQIDTAFAVQLQDGSMVRVPEEEIVFLYNDGVWADSSAPSAPSPVPSESGTKVEIKDLSDQPKQGRSAKQKK